MNKALFLVKLGSVCGVIIVALGVTYAVGGFNSGDTASSQILFSSTATTSYQICEAEARRAYDGCMLSDAACYKTYIKQVTTACVSITASIYPTITPQVYVQADGSAKVYVKWSPGAVPPTKSNGASTCNSLTTANACALADSQCFYDSVHKKCIPGGAVAIPSTADIQLTKYVSTKAKIATVPVITVKKAVINADGWALFSIPATKVVDAKGTTVSTPLLNRDKFDMVVQTTVSTSTANSYAEQDQQNTLTMLAVLAPAISITHAPCPTTTTDPVRTCDTVTVRETNGDVTVQASLYITQPDEPTRIVQVRNLALATPTTFQLVYNWTRAGDHALQVGFGPFLNAVLVPYAPIVNATWTATQATGTTNTSVAIDTFGLAGGGGISRAQLSDAAKQFMRSSIRFGAGPSTTDRYIHIQMDVPSSKITLSDTHHALDAMDRTRSGVRFQPSTVDGDPDSSGTQTRRIFRPPAHSSPSCSTSSDTDPSGSRAGLTESCAIPAPTMRANLLRPAIPRQRATDLLGVDPSTIVMSAYNQTYLDTYATPLATDVPVGRFKCGGSSLSYQCNAGEWNGCTPSGDAVCYDSVYGRIEVVSADLPFDFSTVMCVGWATNPQTTTTTTTTTPVPCHRALAFAAPTADTMSVIPLIRLFTTAGVNTAATFNPTLSGHMHVKDATTTTVIPVVVDSAGILTNRFGSCSVDDICAAQRAYALSLDPNAVLSCDATNIQIHTATFQSTILPPRNNLGDGRLLQHNGGPKRLDVGPLTATRSVQLAPTPNGATPVETPSVCVYVQAGSTAFVVSTIDVSATASQCTVVDANCATNDPSCGYVSTCALPSLWGELATANQMGTLIMSAAAVKGPRLMSTPVTVNVFSCVSDNFNRSFTCDNVACGGSACVPACQPDGTTGASQGLCIPGGISLILIQWSPVDGSAQSVAAQALAVGTVDTFVAVPVAPSLFGTFKNATAVVTVSTTPAGFTCAGTQRYSCGSIAYVARMAGVCVQTRGLCIVADLLPINSDITYTPSPAGPTCTKPNGDPSLPPIPIACVEAQPRANAFTCQPSGFEYDCPANAATTLLAASVSTYCLGAQGYCADTGDADPSATTTVLTAVIPHDYNYACQFRRLSVADGSYVYVAGKCFAAQATNFVFPSLSPGSNGIPGAYYYSLDASQVRTSVATTVFGYRANGDPILDNIASPDTTIAVPPTCQAVVQFTNVVSSALWTSVTVRGTLSVRVVAMPFASSIDPSALVDVEVGLQWSALFFGDTLGRSMTHKVHVGVLRDDQHLHSTVDGTVLAWSQDNVLIRDMDVTSKTFRSVSVNGVQCAVLRTTDQQISEPWGVQSCLTTGVDGVANTFPTGNFTCDCALAKRLDWKTGTCIAGPACGPGVVGTRFEFDATTDNSGARSPTKTVVPYVCSEGYPNTFVQNGVLSTLAPRLSGETEQACIVPTGREGDGRWQARGTRASYCDVSVTPTYPVTMDVPATGLTKFADECDKWASTVSGTQLLGVDGPAGQPTQSMCFVCPLPSVVNQTVVVKAVDGAPAGTYGCYHRFAFSMTTDHDFYFGPAAKDCGYKGVMVGGECYENPAVVLDPIFLASRTIDFSSLPYCGPIYGMHQDGHGYECVDGNAANSALFGEPRILGTEYDVVDACEISTRSSNFAFYATVRKCRIAQKGIVAAADYPVNYLPSYTTAPAGYVPIDASECTPVVRTSVSGQAITVMGNRFNATDGVCYQSIGALGPDPTQSAALNTARPCNLGADLAVGTTDPNAPYNKCFYGRFTAEKAFVNCGQRYGQVALVNGRCYHKRVLVATFVDLSASELTCPPGWKAQLAPSNAIVCCPGLDTVANDALPTQCALRSDATGTLGLDTIYAITPIDMGALCDTNQWPVNGQCVACIIDASATTLFPNEAFARSTNEYVTKVSVYGDAFCSNCASYAACGAVPSSASVVAQGGSLVLSQSPLLRLCPDGYIAESSSACYPCTTNYLFMFMGNAYCRGGGPPDYSAITAVTTTNPVQPTCPSGFSLTAKTLSPEVSVAQCFPATPTTITCPGDSYVYSCSGDLNYMFPFCLPGAPTSAYCVGDSTYSSNPTTLVWRPNPAGCFTQDNIQIGCSAAIVVDTIPTSKPTTIPQPAMSYLAVDPRNLATPFTCTSGGTQFACQKNTEYTQPSCYGASNVGYCSTFLGPTNCSGAICTVDERQIVPTYSVCTYPDKTGYACRPAYTVV